MPPVVKRSFGWCPRRSRSIAPSVQQGLCEQLAARDRRVQSSNQVSRARADPPRSLESKRGPGLPMQANVLSSAAIVDVQRRLQLQRCRQQLLVARFGGRTARPAFESMIERGRSLVA